MRSPRGLGVGRIGAVTISLALGLSALALPAFAGHHLPGESAAEEPKPTKTLRATPHDHVMLVGDSRVINIEMCNADGSGCKPANKTRTTFRPKNGLQRSGNKGAQVKVTGKKPGTYTLQFKQGQATGQTTVTVNEPPLREPTGPTGDDYRVYISPAETTLSEGRSGAFMVWGCLLGPDGRLGANDLPDGVDDECIELDILELDFDETLPMTVLGPQGSTFFVTVEPFPAEIDQDQLFASVQVVTEFGSTLASILAERSAQLEEFETSDVLIGDANGNGELDGDDWSMLWTAMFTGRYDPVFDVDANGVLDEADWNAITGDAPGMPTPLPSRQDATDER